MIVDEAESIQFVLVEDADSLTVAQFTIEPEAFESIIVVTEAVTTVPEAISPIVQTNDLAPDAYVVVPTDAVDVTNSISAGKVSVAVTLVDVAGPNAATASV
jgi:hypothetical protein